MSPSLPSLPHPHGRFAAGPGANMRECVLVTGFPAFSARRMAAKVLAEDLDACMYLLVSEDAGAAVESFITSLPRSQGERVAPIVGAVERMDLGLSGAEYRQLTDELTTIYHLAGIADTTADKNVACAVNIEGTRNVIELASDLRDLRRLCHFSSSSVSGKRKGTVLEDELDRGQSFHNHYERTRFQAEMLAKKAQRRLPISIFRMGILVGDSRTGEIDRFDGPYYLMVALVADRTNLGLPAPHMGHASLNLVPVDFVVDAAYALSVDERAAGRTFHITDPEPLSARRVYELVAECCHTRPPRGVIPGRLARLALRVPGVERLARGHRFFLEELDHRVDYSCQNTLELLVGTGIQCPAFQTYVANLMRFVQESRVRPAVLDDALDDDEPDDELDNRLDEDPDSLG